MVDFYAFVDFHICWFSYLFASPFQARGGNLSYEVALDVFVAVMEKEDNYYVWMAAQNAAKYLKQRLDGSEGEYHVLVWCS